MDRRGFQPPFLPPVPPGGCSCSVWEGWEIVTADQRKHMLLSCFCREIHKGLLCRIGVCEPPVEMQLPV